MPELKRLFVKGRMNQDLDERLVPNGEYRDALNIQIATTEGNDGGTAQNILGNTVAKIKKAQPLTYWDLNTETTNYYGLPLDAVCIGGIKDDVNNKLYWFVTSSEVDCIAEYNDQTGVTRPVLVDKNNVLNFSALNLITGVNIINNILFWTDDLTEPKSIDTTPGIFGSANFSTHSFYKGRDFIESDVTVIKKSPLKAPNMALSNSARNGNAISATFQNFALTPTGGAGIVEPLPVNSIVTGLTLSTAALYLVDDIIVLTGPLTNNPELGEFYTVKARVTARNNGNTQLTSVISIKILSITSQVIDDDIEWDVTLVQDDALFELKFPRFGYRWKYDNNQYSCFSPFTEVAFLPGKFDYNSKKGHNKGMANTVRLITLSNLTTPPDDVKSVEILYKESNNSTVYVVEDYPTSEIEFKISSELIYKVAQSNQLLRPWDNVPRVAKAQEIVGNRVVYGNYLQNYTVDSNVKFETAGIADPTSLPAATVSTPQRSVKSLRTYQAGVVFKDKYGRETPVFTDDSGVIKVNGSQADDTNRITLKPATSIGSIAPFATHFKYFIKETSNEYYNLAADRIYESRDNVMAWISFPSSERNKVSEETYLILKKGHESDIAVDTKDNKYKILSIKNEAPAELTNTKRVVFSDSITFDTSFGSGTAQTVKAPGSTPTEGSKVFLIYGSGIGPGVKTEAKAKLVAGNYIRFTGTGARSNAYEIASVIYDEEGDDEAKVFVTEPFQGDVEFLYESADPPNPTLLLSVANGIEVLENFTSTNNAEFEGKFFVKIEKNLTLKENCFLDSDLITSNTARMYGTQNADADSGYLDNATNIRIVAAGVPAVIYGPNPWIINGLTGGGYKMFANNMPPFADEDGDTLFDVVFEKRNNNRYDQSFINSISSPGTKLQFESDYVLDTTIYEIDQVLTQVKGDKTRYYLKFTTPLTSVVNPTWIAENDGIGPSNTRSVNVLIKENDESVSFVSDNPAIFETEPKEAIDLNIYYEASDAIPAANYQDEYTLSWTNCFSFGNGVESNRIRDDFNTPYIDKGTKASTVLEDPYEQERRATGLIYSGIYNSTSGLNNLNQFIQAEKITKDLNPVYGSIQKLHTRDTNLVALCEDKILSILANKDALFNADGNTNVTSTNNVLGQAVPFAGEYGISKNPESFSSFGFRAYFSDKKRGSMLRLSMDGLTDISSKGMSVYFFDNLKLATTVLGAYDSYLDCYNVTLNNDTISFSEPADGWSTRKSFIPEFSASLATDFYTVKNGMLWSHDNEARNTFYEGAIEKSSIRLIFNDNPSNIKNFKTLSYEGDSGWTTPLIKTDQQEGEVLSYIDKENIYYNYIKGINSTWDNLAQSGTLDPKEFNAQGIGNLASITPYNGNTTFKITVKNDPADAETTYSVTEYNAEAEVGDQVSLDITEFALVITPNIGYVIDETDFTAPVLPTEINSAVFANGANGVVKVTCTFAPGFIMPAGDVVILLDIEGVASAPLYTIDGVYSTIESNTTTSSVTDVPFSSTGNEGDEVTLFTKTFIVAAGHYFDIIPYYYQSPGASRNDSNYIITRSDNAIGAPGEYYVVQSAFTVKYIITDSSETLNDLNFVANAVEFFVAGNLVRSYSPQSVGDFQASGDNRLIIFYGDPGTPFIFTVLGDGGPINNNLTIEDSGSISFLISVPPNSTGVPIAWTFTLSNNLIVPFPQPNPFIINQPSL